MITVIYAHKAGQGVTTITATLAALTARAGKRTLLVAVLGIGEPDRPRLGDYLSDTAITLADIVTPVAENVALITGGNKAPEFTGANYGLLTGGLGHYDTVIIDAGPNAAEWVRHADTRVLITRPCYLALRHANGGWRPDHLVVVTKPAGPHPRRHRNHHRRTGHRHHPLRPRNQPCDRRRTAHHPTTPQPHPATHPNRHGSVPQTV